MQELHKEIDARKRHQIKKAQEWPESQRTDHNSQVPPTTEQSSSKIDGCHVKKFNLQIYKYHALGDYADTTRQYGTTDSYSTEPVSDT